MNRLLIKFEGQYLDENIISHLKKVRLQVFEIQGGRASAFVKKDSKFEEPPDYEKDIPRKLGKMIEKITEILDEDIMDFYNSIWGGGFSETIKIFDAIHH